MIDQKEQINGANHEHVLAGGILKDLLGDGCG